MQQHQHRRHTQSRLHRHRTPVHPLASTHSSTIFATFATPTAITVSAVTLAFAFTMLATALALSALAIPLPPSAPPDYLLACLWVPEPAPNVGAQPTGLEADRTTSADGALLRLSNSSALTAALSPSAVTAALTPSAVTTVAASVEADLRGAGLDLR